MVLVIINVDYPDYQLEEKWAEEQGIRLVVAHCDTLDEVVDAAREADIVVVALQPLPKDAIHSLKHCRIIGRLGVGLDSIDVAAATQRKIAVINVPDYCTEEVASHACSLLLALVRKIPVADHLVRTARWSEWELVRPIYPLADMTLGIVGLGRIGHTVARYMRPMVKNIIGFDPYAGASADLDLQLVGFEELLEQAHLITIHSALTPTTYHLFDHHAFSVMRKGAVLVNVSRGPIISDDDLVQALQSGQLGGAGLDVMETEPPDSSHPLLGCENAIITNHIGWYSESSIIRQRTLMLQRMTDYLNNRPVPSLVNPEVISR